MTSFYTPLKNSILFVLLVLLSVNVPTTPLQGMRGFILSKTQEVPQVTHKVYLSPQQICRLPVISPVKSIKRLLPEFENPDNRYQLTFDVKGVHNLIMHAHQVIISLSTKPAFSQDRSSEL